MVSSSSTVECTRSRRSAKRRRNMNSREEFRPTSFRVSAAGPAAEHLPARPQRVQDDVAQLVVLGHDAAQRGAVDAQHAARERDPRRQEGALPVQQAQLAHERARAHPRQHRLVDPSERVADDLDLAGVDEDQVVAGVARAEEIVAGSDLLRHAERDQARPLGVGERGILDRVEVARLHEPEAINPGGGGRVQPQRYLLGGLESIPVRSRRRWPRMAA